MNLEHLRYFIAVAEEEHITKAAKRLGIQQPPLSQRIKTIEQELNVQLFRRKGRGIELTEAGQKFLEGTHQTLEHLAHTIEETRSTARGMMGQIRVGFVPTCPFQPFVPRLIRAFREAFPRVSVQLEECLGKELLQRLQNKELDAGFLRASMTEAKARGLVVEPLLDEPMLLVLPQDHPLAKREAAIPLKRLESEPFVLYGPEGTGLDELMLQACRAAGFTPNMCQRAPRMTSAISLVAVGLGVTLVPASLQRVQMDGITYRRITRRSQPRVALNLISRGDDNSATTVNFVALAARMAMTFQSDRPDPTSGKK